jgi:hypothetical protein
MMTTAQRPAYNRAPLAPKSSTSGLVLNFSPLAFEDKEVEARVFPCGADGDEQLKKLRNELSHPDPILWMGVKSPSRDNHRAVRNCD